MGYTHLAHPIPQCNSPTTTPSAPGLTGKPRAVDDDVIQVVLCTQRGYRIIIRGILWCMRDVEGEGGYQFVAVLETQIGPPEKARALSRPNKKG